MLLKELKPFCSSETGTNILFKSTDASASALKGESRSDLSPGACARAYLCHSWCSCRGHHRCTPDRCGGRWSTGSPLRNAPSDTGGHNGPRQRTCGLGRGGILNKCRKRTCVFGVQVPVHHHDVEQLVQSSLSGPMHCRHVMSHRWQFPCGLKYSPADGKKTKAPLNHLL